MEVKLPKEIRLPGWERVAQVHKADGRTRILETAAYRDFQDIVERPRRCFIGYFENAEKYFLAFGEVPSKGSKRYVVNSCIATFNSLEAAEVAADSLADGRWIVAPTEGGEE